MPARCLMLQTPSTGSGEHARRATRSIMSTSPLAATVAAAYLRPDGGTATTRVGMEVRRWPVAATSEHLTLGVPACRFGAMRRFGPSTFAIPAAISKSTQAGGVGQFDIRRASTESGKINRPLEAGFFIRLIRSIMRLSVVHELPVRCPMGRSPYDGYL